MHGQFEAKLIRRYNNKIVSGIDLIECNVTILNLIIATTQRMFIEYHSCKKQPNNIVFGISFIFFTSQIKSIKLFGNQFKCPEAI